VFDLLLFLAGLAGLLAGAELAVRGSMALAGRWGWPAWMSGFLLLALGTSLPEFFVSLTAAPQHPDLALGNVLGSNAFNVFLVLGLLLAVRGREGVPSGGLSTAAVGLFAGLAILAGAALGWERGPAPPFLGGLLLAGFAASLALGLARRPLAVLETRPGPSRARRPGLGRDAAVALAGFVLLAAASRLFVSGALGLAGRLGWSEGFAGYLVTAVGTSAPELLTSLRAARLGYVDAVLGNLLGSNLFNFLFVGGLVLLVARVPVDSQGLRPQLLANLLSALVLLPPVLAARRVPGRSLYGPGTGLALVLLWAATAWWAWSAGAPAAP